MGSAIFMRQEKIETRLFGIGNTGNKKNENNMKIIYETVRNLLGLKIRRYRKMVIKI